MLLANTVSDCVFDMHIMLSGSPVKIGMARHAAAVSLLRFSMACMGDFVRL